MARDEAIDDTLADLRAQSLGVGEVASWLDDLRVMTGCAASGLQIHGHAAMLRYVF